MTNGRRLLDTCVVIALFRDDARVQQRLLSVSEAFLSSITVGELYYGAKESAHPAENISQIRLLVDSVTVLPCDRETAWHYGEIKDHLRRKGSPVPENDIWIAAIARRFALTLVTWDTHFDLIDGVSIENW